MLTLDDDQQRAVRAGTGDLFISAGAGSGKTRVLTARFVSAVLGHAPYDACEPDTLLTITFTEKAAGVLSDRIRHELAAEHRDEAARRIGDAWISTIHGMCARVLRRHAFEAGLDPHFSVLDEAEGSALEVAALEDVIAARVDVDRDVVSLLDAYGFENTVAAARRARTAALALGLGVENIRTQTSAETFEVIERARQAFTESAAAFDALRRVKTVENNAAAARTAAMLLQSADDREQAYEPDPAEYEGVSFRRCASVDGNDGIVDSCNVLLDEVKAAVAQLAVAPFEQAFLRLVRAFDERLTCLKAERGALDFQDLQLTTARLLERRADIAATLRDRFTMLMVDEFQDTDALQVAIVNRLARGNLCTVGDEHQSIYAFRSADIGVFRDRRRRTEHSIRLATNYRTAPDLLDSLNGLFATPALLGSAYEPLHAPAAPAERRPWPESQPRFAVRFCDSTAHGALDAKQAEAECIAGRVSELVDAGVAPGEIVVLLGAMRGGRADALRSALDRRSIPVFLAAGGDFFDCREIAEARAFLRVVQNPRDDAALVTVLRGRFTGVSDDGMHALRVAADAAAVTGDRRDGRLWATVVAPPDGIALTPADRAVLTRTVQTVEWARRQRGLRSLGETLLQVFLRLDIDLVMFASGRDGRRAWANLLKLIRLADEYELAAGGDLGGLLDYLAMRETHATAEREAVLEGEASAVRVMSIHAAKGLEFPVVVVGALDRGGDTAAIAVRTIDGAPCLGMRLPGDDRTVPTTSSRRVAAAAAAIDDEESVRLLYVACTRAEEALTIVARTDPTKDAGSTTGGLIRTALGLGSAGTIADEMTAVGAADAHVSLFRAEEVDQSGTEEGRSGACPEPALLPAEPATAVAAFTVPGTVSYTGLSRYASCPYSYYATAVARLPAPPSSKGTDARSFGVAAHRALEQCDSSNRPSDALLEAAAVFGGLDRREIPRLRTAVETFLASETAADVFGAERVLHEAPISVTVGGVVLAGAVDLIAWRSGEVLVVDYKTGAGAVSAEAARERYRLQATCYALAALATGAETVSVRFVELETGRETAYGYAQTDRASLEGAVTGLTDRMRAGEYGSRGTYERDSCETCPAFGSLCPVTRPTDDGAG